MRSAGYATGVGGAGAEDGQPDREVVRSHRTTAIQVACGAGLLSPKQAQPDRQVGGAETSVAVHFETRDTGRTDQHQIGSRRAGPDLDTLLRRARQPDAATLDVQLQRACGPAVGVDLVEDAVDR